MNIDKHYTRFEIGARALNLKTPAEVQVVIDAAVKQYRFLFWTIFPVCVILGLLMLPLFGFGLILLFVALVLWLKIGKMPKIMKAVGERYIAKMRQAEATA